MAHYNELVSKFIKFLDTENLTKIKLLKRIKKGSFTRINSFLPLFSFSVKPGVINARIK